MTETDPRPRLAAALLERLAPAAEALAAACAGDSDAGPPPEDDRDRADYHRAARAGLAHLRQLLAVLDWSARHLPEPEPEQDEVHYLGAVWTGRRDTPEFYAWVKQQDRRERRRTKREKKERRERKATKKALAAQAGGGRDGGREERRRSSVGTDGGAPVRRLREGGDPSPIPGAAAAGEEQDGPFEASGTTGDGPWGRSGGGALPPMSRNPAPPAEGPAAPLHDTS